LLAVFVEGLEGAVEIAAIAGFGAAAGFEGAALGLVAFAVGVLVEDFVSCFVEEWIVGGVEGSLAPFEGFLALHAIDAPTGVGEVLDEVALEHVCGLELGSIRIEKLHELLFRFAGESNEGCVDAVLQGVEGSALLALGGTWASTFLGVDTVLLGSGELGCSGFRGGLHGYIASGLSVTWR